MEGWLFDLQGELAQSNITITNVLEVAIVGVASSLSKIISVLLQEVLVELSDC
ncbi:hypothetical protein IW492_06720 [Enterococcus sp. BWB1-3]|uniref:hypothetical protein n=1 Tax=Enterococcus sp. BWB1-3 TaxID=2787713 RepID=UPI001922B6E8|nr:hypothetical protein [Enterococcus sp. BWB1-3]MBL1228925.1 hypothetical protein [Enterococcus sp. BWB1-3]